MHWVDFSQITTFSLYKDTFSGFKAVYSAHIEVGWVDWLQECTMTETKAIIGYGEREWKQAQHLCKHIKSVTEIYSKSHIVL